LKRANDGSILRRIEPSNVLTAKLTATGEYCPVGGYSQCTHGS